MPLTRTGFKKPSLCQECVQEKRKNFKRMLSALEEEIKNNNQKLQM